MIYLFLMPYYFSYERSELAIFIGDSNKTKKKRDRISLLKKNIYLIIAMADINHGIAGGLAGITVDFVFYPLQTMKTRIMASSSKQNMRSLLLSKFRGIQCQMIISLPYSFIFFTVYESIRHYSNKTVAQNSFSAICAEVVAHAFRNPFEIVKQQLMVGRSSKIFQSLKHIYKNKGVRGFYIGYKPIILRDIVFSGIQLPLFEKLRHKFMEHGYCSVISAAAGGFLAAIISGFVSCPLDVIRTRLMTQKMDTTHSSMMREIYSEYGVNGFFRGVGFRCGILSSSGIIYFGSLQYWRNFLSLQ